MDSSQRIAVTKRSSSRHVAAVAHAVVGIAVIRRPGLRRIEQSLQRHDLWPDEQRLLNRDRTTGVPQTKWESRHQSWRLRRILATASRNEGPLELGRRPSRHTSQRHAGRSWVAPFVAAIESSFEGHPPNRPRPPIHNPHARRGRFVLTHARLSEANGAIQTAHGHGRPDVSQQHDHQRGSAGHQSQRLDEDRARQSCQPRQGQAGDRPLHPIEPPIGPRTKVVLQQPHQWPARSLGS